MRQLLLFAVLAFSFSSHASDLGDDSTVAAIRPEGGRRTLILPKPMMLNSDSKIRDSANSESSCVDPTGRASTNSGPFAETCKGPVARY